MTKLFITWSYVSALWSNLIVPCVTVPSNWQYCTKDMDVWLYPELVRAFDLLTEKETPYQSEQDVLDSKKGR